MTAVRDELLRAVAEGDEDTLRRHGWGPIWVALRSWWKKRFERHELRPYVDRLGGKDPVAILAALEAISETEDGKWRPAPAQIASVIAASGGQDRPAPGPGGGTRPDAKPSAVHAAAVAFNDGDTACDCPRHAQWVLSPQGVLRCWQCGGIELGQLYDAEDAGHLDQQARLRLSPPVPTEDLERARNALKSIGITTTIAADNGGDEQEAA